MSAALVAVRDHNEKLVKQKQELRKEIDTVQGSNNALAKQQQAAQEELEKLQKEIEAIDQETATLHKTHTDLSESEAKRDAEHMARIQGLEQRADAVGQETVTLQLEQVEGSRAYEHQLTELQAAVAKVAADKAKSLQQVHETHAKKLHGLVKEAKELTDRAYDAKVALAEAQKLEASEGEEIAKQMEEVDAALNEAESKMRGDLEGLNEEYSVMFTKYEEVQRTLLAKVTTDIEKTTIETKEFKLNLEAERGIATSELELDRIQQQIERDEMKRAAATKDERFSRDTLRAELLRASSTLNDLQFSSVAADATARADAAKLVAKALGDSSAALGKASDASKKRTDAAGKDEKKYKAGLEEAAERDREITSLEEEIETLKKDIVTVQTEEAAQEATPEAAPEAAQDGDAQMADATGKASPAKASPAKASPAKPSPKAAAPGTPEQTDTPKAKKARGSKGSAKQ